MKRTLALAMFGCLFVSVAAAIITMVAKTLVDHERSRSEPRMQVKQ